FQPLDVCGRASRKASLTLLDGLLGEVHFALGEDFVPLLTPGDAKVTAEAVLAGYGIDVPEKGRDDYAGIDLRGRIAVILRGRPQDGQDWEREFSRTHTYAAAKKRGAVAVLYCQEGGMVAGAALDPEVYDSRIPAAYVSERMLGLLLRETGWTLERWRSRLEQGPQPIATYKRIRFESRTRGPDVATARNVLALLRGSDPALAGDLVIFGAHHDGIGADAAGRVYPGANDNASGTAVVLEAARAARASGWRPRRSVLFVTFAAEELGLLGSAACARQLPWDSTRVVAMVNVDMAGHGDGGFGIAGGSLLGRAYFAWREGLDSLAASRLEEYRLEGGRSDHAPFLDRGIRTATAWSRGDHERYHDYEDRAGYVRPEVLESAGRGIFSLVVALADDPRPVDLARGREARPAADALTIDFSPVDLAALQGDPVRGRLDGDGRMAGRLVALDRSRNGSLDLLAAIGELDGAAERLGRCERAATIEEAASARDRMTLALLPVAPVGTLDGLPAAALRPLLRGGLAGAIWSGASAESSPPLPSLSLIH
ncbi:MAG: M20/M25/M40 family metallo-hydrolase, partial [Candidatus Eisenbacteria bacterium]|nr:M20/M25/M40 family metallo-hydrolase [Candidatus Eisenbacteria bacterium]